MKALDHKVTIYLNLINHTFCRMIWTLIFCKKDKKCRYRKSNVNTFRNFVITSVFGHLRSSYREEGWDPINWFNSATFVCLPKPEL